MFRRSSITPFVLVAGLALSAQACDGVAEVADDARQAVEEGVEAGREAAELVQFCTAAARAAQAVSDEDVEAAVDAGEDMVEHAPQDIRPDAEVVLDGAQRALDEGDRAPMDSEEFRDAAAAVADYTRTRCDPR